MAPRLSTKTAAIDITDTYRGAVRVPAHTVRPGDYVFSTTGHPDRVKRVATWTRTTRITPENLWEISLDRNDTITILRAEEG